MAKEPLKSVTIRLSNMKLHAIQNIIVNYPNDIGDRSEFIREAIDEKIEREERKQERCKHK